MKCLIYFFIGVLISFSFVVPFSFSAVRPDPSVFSSDAFPCCCVGTPSSPCTYESCVDYPLIYHSTGSTVYDGVTYSVYIRYAYGNSKGCTFYTALEEFDEEGDYYLDSSCFCEDGTPISMAYGTCLDGVPSGNVTVVGNVDLYAAIMNEEYVPGLNASCTSSGGSCGYKWEDIQPLIAAVGSGFDCGTNYLDDDGDGVKNDDDNCPGTAAGVVVDQFGCEQADSDGDGVVDDDDLCPETPLNMSVDRYGCSDDDDDDDDDEPDSDGDGVPDDEDNCPNTPAGSTVGVDGCVPPPDPGDGDDDDDNELLSDIVDWLKTISGKVAGIFSNVEDIESTAENILGAQRATAGKVQDVVDETKKSNSLLLDIKDAIAGIDAGESYDDSGLRSDVGDVKISVDDVKTSVDDVKTSVDDVKTSVDKISDLVNNESVTSGQTDWASKDGSEYNSTNFSTEFIEGTDYAVPGDLKDEGWLSDFIANNPLKIAFEGSGINTSGSCSVIIDCGSLGLHPVSLCEFESGFQLAGGLLYGLTVLSSLLLIAKGGA